MPGETAVLHCDYDLGGDALYAVKWYKEHEEFYRYVPRANPPATSYKLEGVHVDVSMIYIIRKDFAPLLQNKTQSLSSKDLHLISSSVLAICFETKISVFHFECFKS